MKVRRWKVIGHTLEHLKELLSIIIEGMVEGRTPPVRLGLYCFLGQIKKDAR